jgi:apolipoprotein N-acyltransferase
MNAGRWTLVVISFVMVAFGQPAFVPWLGLMAAVCGFALFWVGARVVESRLWRALLSGAWFFGTHLIQLSWMTSDLYHGIYIWISWALLCLVMGIEFGVLSLIIPRRGNYTLMRILAVPALWTLMEWGRLFILSGYTWNPVGLSLTGADLPRQLTTVGGIYGLSFWVMLTNVLVLWAFDGGLKARRWAVASLAALTPYLFGTLHMAIHADREAHSYEDPVRVVLVQTGISPGERAPVSLGSQDALHPLEQWQRVAGLLSRWRGEEIDLVVFPEGTVPYTAMRHLYEHGCACEVLSAGMRGPVVCPNEECAMVDEIDTVDWGRLTVVNNAFFCQALANTLQCDVVVGLDSVEETGCYNAAILFQPGKEAPVDRYGKRVLLPFAEYMPGEWTRILAERYGITGSFTPGESARVFKSKVPLGMTVCYDETFSNLIRENKGLGAEMLVSITNDGWYPDSRLPAQHFHHGRLRALENGMPLVRASATGVTAAVDSLGRTIAIIENYDSADTLYVEVPRYHYRTLYSWLGDGLPVGLSLLIVLVAARQRIWRP